MKILALLAITGACLAGDFINLSFDEPNLTGTLTPIYPGGPLHGNTTDLLRGWSVKLDAQNLSDMFFSPFPFSSVAPVGLRGNSPADASTALGAYSLVLESLPPNVPTIRISQQGTVPVEANGLLIASAGYVQAFANGTKVGEVNPMLGSQVVLDLSIYGGQGINLEFLVRAGESARFDIIGFTSVPEPSTWALLGVGTAAIFFFSRKKT
jgi:PEP-CTERM motif